MLALATLSGPLEARRLEVIKRPNQWAEIDGRGASGTETRVQRISRAQERLEALPEDARHGHLQLGGPPTSLFERRVLERRPGIGRGGGGTDTTVIKIAVIRIEFETDRKGSQTTGDGKFLREDSGEYLVDYAPHNTAYFEQHIEAVSRYWSSMTYGRVKFEGTVFPQGEEFGSYLLPDMADYGPRNDEELFNLEGLTNYSRESLIAADADSNLVWSDFDVYFVVHAGADWQNDVFGDTPFDLPTFSIVFSDSELVVTDEGDTLTTMITYPESASQDGFTVALNGGIAHEMGHQLGLFDVYNVFTFAPTVAYYDIMDSGNLASVIILDPDTNTETEVIGVLPTSVGAWSRWLVTFQLGIDPFKVTGDLPRARLRAIQSRENALPPGTYKWLQVPITDTEYFMVENRVDDLDGRDGTGAFNTALDLDEETGVVLGPIDENDEISHNYDLLIDPGVLIWHIDERQAIANLTQGQGLNTIYEKRAVTIEEADGIIDIGSPFSLFPLGTPNEAWHADNASNFTPDSRPNSDSNVGTPSGISIVNIGPRDSTVTLDVLFTSKPAGWPTEIGSYGTSERTAPLPFDSDGDGDLEISAVGENGAFVFEFQDDDGDGAPDFAGTWPQPMVGEPEFSHAWADFDGDGTNEMVASTDSGAVYAWNADGTPAAAAAGDGLLTTFAAPNGLAWSPTPADLNRDGADELYTVTLDGRLRGWDAATALTETFSRPLLGAQADSVDTLVSTLAFGDLDDDFDVEGLVSYVYRDSVHVQRFDENGTRIFRRGWPLPASLGANEHTRVWLGLADLDRKPNVNDLEIVMALENGYVLVVNPSGTVLPGWPVDVEESIQGPPAFGDVDQDGLLEMALTSGRDQVHAFNYNGSELAGWPRRAALVDHPATAAGVSPPIIADVDGDGRQDILVGFPDFTVKAFRASGDLAEGFPIPTGGPVLAAPAVVDANGDGRLDLYIQSRDGQVYSRTTRGVASRENPQWPMYGGGPQIGGAFDPARLPQLSAGQTEVLDGPVVVYPNPVRKSDSEFRVRYTLGPNLPSATEVDIQLFNLAGERLESVQGTIFPNTENVVTMRSENLATGVYICSIRARSGSLVEVSTEKFAVIR